ncbi:MAG: ABC transporter substrate-binding protein [Treponema sp.]|nr:ABC transporter substrate-binding protein [Treponema sp.]
MKKFFLLCCCLALSSFSLQAGAQRDTGAPLEFGIVTAVDSLPIMVARDMGFFQEEGVNVNITLFPNPLERDAAIQAGRLDGAVNDLLAAAFFAVAGFDFRITSMTNGRFGIVASPQSGITSLAELRGGRVGLFTNTMTQFIADSLLQTAGVPADEYYAVAVPNILLRLEMVLSGLVDAAVLPEPLLTAAVAQGAALLSTTDNTGLEAGLLFFSRRALDTRLDEVRAFHRAYYRAAMKINANPDAFRDFLVDQAGFPAAVRDTFQFVAYTQPALPHEQDVSRALYWLRARGLLRAEISREDLIDHRAIGEWLD